MGGRRARENYGGFGPERQDEIFSRGLSGETASIPIAPDDLETAAKEKLPPEVFDFVAGGAGSEETMLANLEAFRRRRIVPRLLIDVSARDTRVELFGKTLPAPFLFAPIGLLEVVHPDGVLPVARAAATLGLPLVLSSRSSHTIEETAGQMGDSSRWFQLNYGSDRDLYASMIARAEASGYSALVMTIDTKTRGWREREFQHASSSVLRGAGTANYLADPVFRKKFGIRSDDGTVKMPENIGIRMDPGSDMRALKLVKEMTRLPVLLKGILSPSDARLAVDGGADGMIVSNHGGRQLDGAVAALDALPAVVREVDGRVPVLFDSGIRRGSDAFKAMALGANAVLVGRPYVWALALGGEAGVVEVAQNILAHFDVTMALSGATKVREITSDLIQSA
jgi:lactate 2-monooxygenase